MDNANNSATAALKHIAGHWQATEDTGDPAYALDIATCATCKEMALAAIAKAEQNS